jgi:hypothetical protein
MTHHKSKRKAVPKTVKASVRRMNKSQLMMLLIFIQAMLKPMKAASKGSKHRKGKKSKHKGKKRRRSAKQIKNAQRFKAFVKRHGRGPLKGEKLWQ